MVCEGNKCSLHKTDEELENMSIYDIEVPEEDKTCPFSGGDRCLGPTCKFWDSKGKECIFILATKVVLK